MEQLPPQRTEIDTLHDPYEKCIEHLLLYDIRFTRLSLRELEVLIEGCQTPRMRNWTLAYLHGETIATMAFRSHVSQQMILDAIIAVLSQIGDKSSLLWGEATR